MVIRLTLWWKLSPLVWMLLLFIVLFIPMQWGAPAGSVTQYHSVVEIVPNVSGTIIEVPIEGNKSLKKSDMLFKTRQLKLSGEVPEQPAGQQPPDQYAVILKINGTAVLPLGVPGGAIGTAAIYTDSARATQIIRKVMVGMQAWKNYISPG